MHPYNSASSRDSDWDDISSAAKLRKIRKPLVERKRRERINTSLMELKSLILQAMAKKEVDYDKMEKADILEMTVHFLRTLQQNQRFQATRKYHDGFQECANEVRRYLSTVSGVEHTVRRRMEQFLTSRAHPKTEVIKPEVTRLRRVPIPLSSPMAFFPGYYSCSQETPATGSSIHTDSMLKAEELQLASLRQACVSASASSSSSTSAAEGSCSSTAAGTEHSQSHVQALVRRTLFSPEELKVKREPRDIVDTPAAGEGERVGRAERERGGAEGGHPENPTESAWRPWS